MSCDSKFFVCDKSVEKQKISCIYRKHRFVGFSGKSSERGRRARYELAPRGKQRHVEMFVVFQ